MSAKAFSDFRTKMSGDQALQADWSDAMKGGPGEVVALGMRHGYEFTPAEAEAELSDLELERAVGGAVTDFNP